MLRYEVFDEESGRWLLRFKSINPTKPRELPKLGDIAIVREVRRFINGNNI